MASPEKTRKPKILAIAGATSVGKTELSLKLASLLNGEIISADSAQVFSGLDIGSAKVGPKETAAVRHHLLDVAEMDTEEKFTMADFSILAAKAIEDIVSRGRVPLIVGGTGSYMQMLLDGGPTGAPRSTEACKAWINKLIETEDGGEWDRSYRRLQELDPVYASTIECNDWYRLKRALEICYLTGSTVTSYKKDIAEEDYPYDSRCLYLTMPRIELFQRIDARCELIVQEGLFQEVISLVRAGRLKPDSQAGRSLGYRQALEFLRTVWGFPAPIEGGVSSTEQDGGFPAPIEGLLAPTEGEVSLAKQDGGVLAPTEGGVSSAEQDRGFPISTEDGVSSAEQDGGFPALIEGEVSLAKQDGGFPAPTVGGAKKGAGLYSLQVPEEEITKHFHEFLLVYKAKTRQLANSQRIWFKKDHRFQWVNIAPEGHRLSMETLSEALVRWFNDGVPLPEEWDGTATQEVTRAEKKILREYSAKSTPQIYSSKETVDALMASIEKSLNS